MKHLLNARYHNMLYECLINPTLSLILWGLLLTSNYSQIFFILSVSPETPSTSQREKKKPVPASSALTDAQMLQAISRSVPLQAFWT